MSDAMPAVDPATALDPADPRVELALELFRDGPRTLAEVAAVLRGAPPSPPAPPWSRQALGATRAAVLEVAELEAGSAATAPERAARMAGPGRRALEQATERSRGPALPRLIAVLGRDEVLRRLVHALDGCPVGGGTWR
jgi:hypothetical protein